MKLKNILKQALSSLDRTEKAYIRLTEKQHEEWISHWREKWTQLILIERLSGNLYSIGRVR